MHYQKIKLSIFVSLLVVLSASFVPRLPMVLMTLGVLAQSRVERQAEADTLLEQGHQQYQANQLEAALQSFQKALIIYRDIKNREFESLALFGLGMVHDRLQDYPKAIDYYKQSLAISREIKVSEFVADALLNQGHQQYQTSQFIAALQSWEQALQIYREIKDRNGEGNALGNLGVAYNSLGDYPKAIDYQQQSLKIARKIKDRKGEGKSLGNLSNTYYFLGDYPKAINYSQQSLKIAQEIQDRLTESRVLGTLGNTYYSLGDYPKAINYHQQSLKIAREIKDRKGEVKSLVSLGAVYSSLGDYPKAVKYHQQSLRIAREINDRGGEVAAFSNLGVTYRILGDYPKAIDYQQQSLKIAREIKNRKGEGAALGNLGIAYHSLGDYLKAIEYYEQHLKIAREIKHRYGESAALGNLGLAYHSLGDYPKAIDYQQQRLKIAREIKDREAEGGALINLGIAYGSLGNYPKAIDYQQQSLKIAREIKDRLSEGAALNNLGVAYYEQRNLTLAENTLMEGIKVYESLRGRELKDNEKVTFFDTQRRIYRILQEVLIAQNKIDAALEISERGRGRAFVELLASRLSTNPEEQAPTAPNIAEIKQIAKSQNTTLVQYSIIGDEFKIAGKPQYKQSELYIWVIKPTGEVTFRKADLKPLWQKENTTLAELVTTSRNSIGARGAAFRGIEVSFNPDAPKATNKLKRLHELLINPIADLLPKNPSARVTFIPQSSLFLVPFPALQDKNGKYLIEKHTILTSPSIQVLELTREKRQQIGQRIGEGQRMGNNMLIVGNPTMPKIPPKIGEAPQQLTPLPGAEREAKAIAKLFGAKPLIGNEATETKVTQRLPQARLIHLATHGLFDDVQGLNSGIALAPNPPLSPLIKEGNEKGDGLLTAGEILDLKLNAELVVLSACDTGRGKISGDGVIGLSRSLISAGVPSVLVSLWSVPDAPTAELMTQFYQNLQNNPDKAQALRQAMLKIMKQHPNPRDWAAFTLIGEAE